MGPNANEINTKKKKEKYMANARNFCVGDPMRPIFHLFALGVGIEGNANFSVRVGGNANFSIFRYQYVGIPNAKLWRWGSKPTPGPNAKRFASQWNIGLSLQNKSCIYLCIYNCNLYKIFFSRHIFPYLYKIMVGIRAINIVFLVPSDIFRLLVFHSQLWCKPQYTKGDSEENGKIVGS